MRGFAVVIGLGMGVAVLVMLVALVGKTVQGSAQPPSASEPQAHPS